MLLNTVNQLSFKNVSQDNANIHFLENNIPLSNETQNKPINVVNTESMFKKENIHKFLSNKYCNLKNNLLAVRDHIRNNINSLNLCCSNKNISHYDVNKPNFKQNGKAYNNFNSSESKATSSVSDNNSSYTNIPKNIHFIWLGDNPIPHDAVSNIINAWHKNQDHKIYLWTDNPHKIEKDILDAGISNAFLSKIVVKQPQLSTKIAAAIARECTDNDFSNYAAASDIMRLAILKEYGGIYLDVDVALSEPFREMTCPNNPFDCLVYIVYQENEIDILNGAIVAPKESKAINAMLDSLISTYKPHNPTLGLNETNEFKLIDVLNSKEELNIIGKKKATTALSIDKLIWQEKRVDPDFRLYGTIYATGPGLLYSHIKKHLHRNKDFQQRINLWNRAKNIGCINKYSINYLSYILCKIPDQQWANIFPEVSIEKRKMKIQSFTEKEWEKFINNLPAETVAKIKSHLSVEQREQYLFGVWSQEMDDSAQSWLDRPKSHRKISEI